VRILAVTHQFPTPLQPTFASYNRQQFAELSQMHELRVIRPVPWTIAAAHWARGKWMGRGPSRVGSIEVLYPVFYYSPRVGAQLYGRFFEASVRGLVERVIESYKPDVLLTSWAHPDGWAAARLAHRARLPVVLKVLGSDVLVLSKGRRRKHVADALRSVDTVIAVSQDLARHVVSMGVPAERVHVVPEGLSAEQFSPGDRDAARVRLGLPRDGKLILFVGSVLKSKGAADLVQACGLLRDRGLSFFCRIVGHGADAASVGQLIQTFHLTDRVVCTGVRPHSELVDWYRASDVVTLPSYTEGIPNVLREAIACGKPFVSTHVGGIPEIADRSFSRLVQPGAIVELADALAAMLQQTPSVDPDVVRKINISWHESARLLAGHLESAVASRTGVAL
jgi:glycosyltransferase involved in cell wall biosynthesis